MAASALMGCASSSPKPIVNEPLKLVGPQDAKTHICGETGCDEEVEALCGEGTMQLLDKQFIDNSGYTKNHHTGQFQKHKDQTTKYLYRCI